MDRVSFLSEAQTMLDQGAYENALQSAKQWLDQNPGDVDALIIQCHACMRLGKLEEATSLVEDVEMVVLGLSRVFACMGDICFKGGLNQEAVKFYRRFMALNPDADLSRDVSGKLRILEEDQGNLLREFRAVEAPEPPIAASLQTLTMVDLYIRQGHLDAAESLLKQILIKTPDDSAVQEKLRDVLAAKSALEKKAIQIRQREKVIQTLNRWLNSLQKRRRYAF
ncbi:MAG: Tetratricopeptide repeat protein [Syntrophus sp. PtaU1.Bin208]|nr:MAG: Tetratricopeptide repeat protein [Syntrophus sp. PtaU1.Bin208]